MPHATTRIIREEHAALSAMLRGAGLALLIGDVKDTVIILVVTG